MQEKTLGALHWIVEILDKHQIPYRIGGGFAAHVYGATRPVNDIDISLSGEYFPVIVSETKKYIHSGPKHYSNEKWDCDTLVLNYYGQEMDVTDIDTLRMSNLDMTKWYQTKDNFRKYPTVMTNIDGIDVSIIDPRDLVAYKSEMDGEHQASDVEAVKEYIKNHNI
jgi:hypothetical protein